MTVKMIIAVDRGNAIGWKDGRLPWKIPADMKRFKELTTGSTVLMGRKTFESLKRPAGLPGRKNLVLSRTLQRNKDDVAPVAVIRASLKEAVEAHQAGLGCEPEDLWIIGGAQVYAEAIEKQLVDELYLTLVNDNSEADVTLPFDLAAWKHFVLQQEKVGVKWVLTDISDPQATADGLRFTFLTLKKQP